MALVTLMACTDRKPSDKTPWGTTVGEKQVQEEGQFTWNDIITNGEMIVLTMSQPDVYYEYHNRGLGAQYLLCEWFCRNWGVSVRVEVCKDTSEMVDRLKKGEADAIVYPLPRSLALNDSLLPCGAYSDEKNTAWAVRDDSKELADSFNHWYRPELLARAKQFEDFLFSSNAVQRHVYAPIVSEARGVISNYDHLFQRYASSAGTDWRLLAALSYQESCFDPQARSWAGACGLMQLMPSTAAHLGVSNIFNPESNIAGGARYIGELSGLFNDVSDPSERMNFVLASYNGGHGHVRDAMALTRKYGGNPHRWNDVSQFILRLSDPQFYRDPVVHYGYMRGTETYNYVLLVRQRYMKYSGVASPAVISTGPATMPTRGGVSPTPQRATKPHRFKID
ncbi:MAG: transglycosylase SLT domain-containing protein [Prevotella sp.]|nr:transglycosylase SLT domain-containing protein [Prevotella sp.]